MEQTELIAVVTYFLTILLGFLAKKSEFISNKLIPIQNLLVGLIVAIIEWIITNDFSTAIALSGLMAGGVYDIGHNLSKFYEIEDEEDDEEF